jgi:CRISPR-associated protein Cmr6
VTGVQTCALPIYIGNVARQTVPDFYKAAFARWKQAIADGDRFASWQEKLSGRLYIGVVRENALETGITVSHTYGMPMIPGSAVKGLTRACSGDWLDNDEACRWMFGNEWGEGDAKAETGGLIFHDAWWVPEGQPFAAETVTVHHQGYYGSQGKTPATDFDSPVPAPQIAARGAFLFVIEGPPMWTRLAQRLLSDGLRNRGIGGKRSSGYGFFITSDKWNT